MFLFKQARICSATLVVLGVVGVFAQGSVVAAEKLPFKLFDTHAHFITNDFANYPLTSPESALKPGEAKPAPNPNGGAKLVERLNKDAPKAERIFEWWDHSGVEAGVGVQYRTAYWTNNSYLLDSADRYPTRIAPVVILDARDEKTPGMLRDMVKNHGVSGIRMTGQAASSGWLDSPEALRTWAVANELGIVVVLMASSPDALVNIATLADKFPKVNIVLDHVAFPAMEGAPSYGLSPGHLALQQHKNIYYKFTTLNLDRLKEAKLPAVDFLRHAVDVYSADHMLWGSDVGNSTEPYAEMVDQVIAATAKLSMDEKRQLLHDTGRKLFVRGGRTGK